MDLKEFANSWIDCWNTHDKDKIAAMYHPDFSGIDISASIEQNGREGIKQFADFFFSAFPDLKFSVHEIITTENYFSMHWSASGTQLGPLFGVEPTGKEGLVDGISHIWMKEGMVFKATLLWDMARLFRTLGINPTISKKNF